MSELGGVRVLVTAMLRRPPAFGPGANRAVDRRVSSERLG